MEFTKLKILVIRFSSIGDIVLTSPVLRCLKKIEGHQVELHVATKKNFASFVANYPYVDKVHVLDGNLSALISDLEAENFDYVTDLHNNLRSLRVKMALRKPSASFRKLNIQKWLLTRWKINRLPDIHIVDRYMQAALKLGVVNDNYGLDYFIKSQTSIPADIPAEFQKDHVAFVIGGNHATKRLPNEKIIEICRRLDQKTVLLGGPEDAENADLISKQAGNHVFNCCGKLSLDQSALMVKNSKVVISHDTGLMHIAAAFNKPLISVWGNTIPGFGMYPYMPQHPELSHIVEIKDLPCRPCSKIGYSKCPLGHFDCMNKISEEEVVRKVLFLADFAD
jgi:ADP-heptose:LPS heptosyltransferase